MPVQMFTDESGWKGQGTFIVMAGLIAESESWASFAATWQACLDERPRVSYFKAREAFSLRKEFGYWSEDARNGKVRDLTAVLNAHAPLMLFSAIELAPFEDTIARRSIKLLRQPYFWLFHVMTISACRALHAIERTDERFEAIFDEQAKFGPLARDWYQLILDLLEPSERATMPITPTFQSDLIHLPLQASDLVAFLLRTAFERNEGDQLVSWLEKALPGVAVSDQSQVFRGDRLARIAAAMDTAKITPEMLKRRRDLLGF